MCWGGGASAMPMGSPVGLSEWHKPSGKNVERAKRKAGMNLRAACKVRRGEAGQPLPQPPSLAFGHGRYVLLVFESGLILGVSGSHAFCSAAVQLSLPYSGLCRVFLKKKKNPPDLLKLYSLSPDEHHQSTWPRLPFSPQ